MSRRDRPTLAVVGAGFGGIGLGVYLKRAGFSAFTVFEKSRGPGGTWWDNTYPGAECDVPSDLYCYSFKQDFDWSRSHGTHDEIRRYFEAVVDEHNLRPHLRLGTTVTDVAWDDAAGDYVVRTDDGRERRFDVVVSALGMLNHPRYPEWPGLETFRGPRFHTAGWEHEHDLTGKRIAVAGNGSSAAQVVPALAPHVGELLNFQREPNWIGPKKQRDYSAQERARRLRWYGVLERRYRRAKAFAGFQRARSGTKPGSRRNLAVRRALTDYIAAEVHDPDVRSALTPDYTCYCKRQVYASGFYAAFNRPNVRLIPHAIASVTPSGVVDATGAYHEVDAIVMATGFQATNLLATLEVKGSGGRRLHDVWGTEPQAFLGLMVPGFPNFFMLYGPNTNCGCVVFNLECQSRWIVSMLKGMAPRSAVEVRPQLFAGFNRWVQDQCNRTTWGDGCHTYYHSPQGSNVTQWPGTQLSYWALTRLTATGVVRRAITVTRSTTPSVDPESAAVVAVEAVCGS